MRRSFMLMSMENTPRPHDAAPASSDATASPAALQQHHPLRGGPAAPTGRAVVNPFDEALAALSRWANDVNLQVSLAVLARGASA